MGASSGVAGTSNVHRVSITRTTVADNEPRCRCASLLDGIGVGVSPGLGKIHLSRRNRWTATTSPPQCVVTRREVSCRGDCVGSGEVTISMVTGRRPLQDFVDNVDGRVACLAFSKDPNAKVTVLVFPPGESSPAYVAKVPTTDVAASSVQLEASALASLDRTRLGALEETVPRVTELADHRGRPVLVTTALPGRVMLANYHRWRHTARPGAVQGDFDAAGRWLSELQERTSRGRSDLSMLLEGVVPLIARRYREDPSTASDLEILKELCGRLQGHSAPRGLVHGDYWVGNLLISDGKVCGVIDWELCQSDGIVIRDWARFAVGYSLYLDRHTRPGRRVSGHHGLRAGEWGAGLEYALDGAGWYPDVVRTFLTTGLQRLGMPVSCLRDVVLAEIARIAAEADQDAFAKDHLRLLRRLHSRSVP